MNAASTHPLIEREELPPQLMARAGIYAPLILAVIWIIRVALRAGHRRQWVTDMPQRSAGFTQNRQLRRAQLACIRSAQRFALKYNRTPRPEDFMPRAYAHFSYALSLPHDITAGQFMQRYARDSGLGRVRVLGLFGAHHITDAHASCVKPALKVFPIAVSPISLAAPCDPDPP